MQELLLFFFETDDFLLTLIGERILRFEGAVLEVTLCLGVDKSAHFAGLFSTIIPTVKRLLYVDALILPLVFSCSKSIELLKEPARQIAYGQKSFTPLIEIDVFLGLEIDVLILRIEPRIRKTCHFLLHVERFGRGFHQWLALALLF